MLGIRFKIRILTKNGIPNKYSYWYFDSRKNNGQPQYKEYVKIIYPKLTRLTLRFLKAKEEPPKRKACGVVLTIKHVIPTECRQYRIERLNYNFSENLDSALGSKKYTNYQFSTNNRFTGGDWKRRFFSLSINVPIDLIWILHEVYLWTTFQHFSFILSYFFRKSPFIKYEKKKKM